MLCHLELWGLMMILEEELKKLAEVEEQARTTSLRGLLALIRSQ